MASENEYILRLVLDATRMASGSDQGRKALEAIAAAAASSGEDVESFTRSVIRAASELAKSGRLTRGEVEQLERLAAEYRKVSESIAASSRGDEKQSFITRAISRARSEIDALAQSSKAIDFSTLTTPGAGGFNTSVFNDIITKGKEVREEMREVDRIMSALFKKPLGGDSGAVINVFRTLGNELKNVGPDANAASQAVAKIRQSVEDLGSRSKPAQEALARLADIQNRLSAGSDLSATDIRKLRAEIRGIISDMTNLQSGTLTSLSRTGLMGGTADEIRSSLELRKRELQAVNSIIQADRERLEGIVKSRDLQKTFASVSPIPQEQAAAAGNLLAFEALVRTSKEFQASMQGNATTVQGLNAQVNVLGATLQRFDNDLVKSIPVTKEFAETLNSTFKGTGLLVKEGDNLSATLDKIRNRYDQAAAAQNKLTTGMKGAVSAQSALNERFRNFDQLMTIAIDKIIRYRVAFFLMSQTVLAFRNAVETFKEVQNTIAGIEKVMEPVGNELDKLREKAFDFSVEFGISVKDTLATMKLFAQQGKEFNEVLELTRITLLAVNAADVNATEAAEALTAITKAYKLEVADLAGILDKLTNVQAKHAVTTQDLFDSMKLIASAAQSVGVEFDQLVGLTTALVSITRKSGNAVAQSLKTIFTRFERNETIEELQALGVQVQNTDGTLVPLLEVLTKLRGRWDSLNEAQRVALSETIAGVRRYTDFLALMTNFDEAIIATRNSVVAQGQAVRNNLIQLRTFQTQLDQLTASFQKLFTLVAEGGLAQFVGGLALLAQKVGELSTSVDFLPKLFAFGTVTGVVLLAGKAFSVLANILSGHLAKALIGVAAAEAVVVSSTEATTAAQQKAAAAAAIQGAGVKQLLPLIKALILGQYAQIAVGAETITVNGAVAASSANVGHTVEGASLSFEKLGLAAGGAAAKTKGFSAGMALLGASLSSVAGIASIVIGAISLFAFFARKNETSNIKYSASLVEVTKGLQLRANAERDVIALAKRQIQSIAQIQTAINGLSGEEDKRFEKLALLNKRIQTLTQTDSRFSKGIILQKNSLYDLNVAYDILGKKEQELADLETRFEVNRAKAVQQLNLLTKEIDEVSGAIEKFTSSGGEIKIDSEKVERVLATLEQTPVLEVETRFSNITGGGASREEVLKRFLKGEVTQIAAAASAVGEAVQPNIEALKRLSEVLGEEVPKNFDPQTVEEWRDTLLAAIEREITPNAERARDILASFNGPFDDMINQLEILRKQATQTFAKLFELELLKIQAEDFGFTWQTLVKIVSESTVRFEDALNNFKALDSSLRDASDSVANLEEDYARFGITINAITLKAEEARKVIQEYADARLKLNQVVQNPTKFVDQTIAILERTLDLTQDLEKKKVNFEKFLLSIVPEEQDTLEKAINYLEKNTTLKRSVLEALGSAKNNEELREATVGLIEGLREAESNSQLLSTQMNSILGFADDMSNTITEWSPQLRIALQAERDFAVAVERRKLLNESIVGILEEELSIIQDLDDQASATDLVRLFTLEEELNLIEKKETLAARLAILELKGVDLLKHRGLETEGLLADEQKIVDVARQRIVILQDEAQKMEVLRDISRDQNESLEKSNDLHSRQNTALNETKSVLEEILSKRVEILGVTRGAFELIKAQDERKLMEEELKVALDRAAAEAEINEEARRRIDEAKKGFAFLQGEAFDVEEFDRFAELLTSITGKDKDIKRLRDALVFQAARVVLAELGADLDLMNEKMEFQKGIQESLIRGREDQLKVELELLHASQEQIDLFSARAAEVRAREEIRQKEDLIKAQLDLLDISHEDLDTLLKSESIHSGTIRALQQEIKAKAEALELDTESSRVLDEFLVKLIEALNLVEGSKLSASIALAATQFGEVVKNVEAQAEVMQTVLGQSEFLTRFLQREQIANLTETIRLQTKLSDTQRYINTQLGVGNKLEADMREDRDLSQKAAAAESDIISTQMEDAAKGAFKFNEGLAESERELKKLKALLDPRTINLQNLLEAFTVGFSNAISAITDNIGTIPDFVSEKFDEIGSLQDEITRKQAEIINLTNKLDPKADDFKQAKLEIERAEKELAKLQEELEKTQSIGEGIKEVFVNIATGFGDAVSSINTQLLEQQLKEVAGTSFEAIFREQIQELDKRLGEDFRSGSVVVGDQIILAANYHAKTVGDAIIAAATTGIVPDPGAQNLGDVQRKLAATDPAKKTSENTEDLVDQGKELTDETVGGFNALKKAIFVMGVQISQGIGQAIGGGGTGSRIGSQLGGLLAFAASGGPLSFGGALLGIVGSLAGGLLGGQLDSPEERVPIEDLIDSVDENTRSVDKNTQAFNDLRSLLINAPASFILPAAASQGGGFVGSEFGRDIPVSGAGGGGLNVSITIQGNATTDVVNQIGEAVSKAYAQQQRRFGRRAAR